MRMISTPARGKTRNYNSSSQAAKPHGSMAGAYELAPSEAVTSKLDFCCGAAGLSACSVGPDFKPPETELPGSYVANLGPRAAASGSGRATNVDLTQWWRSFRDPQLVSLVERAITANPDIAIALSRLQQARARQFVVSGAALPKGELSAGAGVGTGSDNTRGRVSEALHSAGNTTGFDHVNEAGGFDLAWELDVFGKLRREIEASQLDALAAAKARDAVLVSVIANVARAYIELRGYQAQLAAIRRNMETASRSFRSRRPATARD